MRNQFHETAPKEEEEEEQEDKDRKSTSYFQNHLWPKTRETELRLGLSSNGSEDMGSMENTGQVFSTAENLCGFVLKQRNGGFGAKRWFSETGDGFANSWGQERAVFDQSQPQRVVGPSPVVQRAAPVVGWPPVRAFRKNLAPHLKADQVETTKDGVKPSVEVRKKIDESMFVKVNMEGYAVGRKINLKAHDSYDSLSRALQQMFTRFFSVNCSKNQEKNEGDEVVTPDHVLIYEDNEGDRMLVGDVPWEMFISTVKRLYIISGSRPPALVAGRAAKIQQ